VKDLPEGICFETEEIKKEVIRLRRHFHAHPELSWEETETQKAIMEYLTSLGLICRPVGGTGVITEIRIFGDFFGTEDVSRLEAALIGVPLRREALLSALSAPSCPLSACIAGAGPEDVAALLLGETEPALNTET